MNGKVGGQNGMATWTGQGIGRFTGQGKISFCGSVFYRTSSTGGGKLSSINNVVGVFEYEVDGFSMNMFG